MTTYDVVGIPQGFLNPDKDYTGLCHYLTKEEADRLQVIHDAAHPDRAMYSVIKACLKCGHFAVEVLNYSGA